MSFEMLPELPILVLDALPNPVLVKDEETRYVWVNAAFESRFEIDRAALIGQLDADAFPHRQAAQCNGGDLRVLESGEVDEAVETVEDPTEGSRVMITRKSRIEATNGQRFLIGVMHDITEVTEQNRRLFDLGTTLEQQATELTRIAATDPLTGCLNRRSMLSEAAHVLGRNRSLGVIALDLDHFKAVNDTFGHDAGDETLRHVVDVAIRVVRDNDIVARRSGEEFIVMLPDVDEELTQQVAERIRKAIEDDPVSYEATDIPITVSVGAVHHAGGRVDFESLLRVADQRLYEAKRLGRNQTVFA